MSDTKSIPLFYIWALLGGLTAYLHRLLLARTLEPEIYGTYFAVVGLVAFLALINDSGLNQSFIYHVLKWPKRIKSVFTQVLILRAGLSIAIGSIFFFFHEPIAIHFFHNPALSTPLFYLCVFFGFEALASLIGSYFGASGKQGLYSSIGSLRMVLSLLLAGLGYLFFNQALLTVYFIAWFLSYLLTILLYVWWVPFTKLITRKVTFDRAIVSYALFAVFSGAGTLVLNRIDVLFITFFRGTYEVGLYEIAVPLASIFALFIDPFVMFLAPAVMRRHHGKGKKQLGSALSLLYDVGIFLAFPIALFILIFAREIILVLFGSEYLAASSALMILAVAFFFRAFQTINGVFLAGIGKPQAQAAVTWWGAIINVILNLIFIPLFGFIAAAWTTLISFMFMLFYSGFVLRKHIYFPVDLNKWAQVILFSAALIFLELVLKRVVDLPAFWEVVVLGGSFALLYYGLGILFGIIKWRLVWRIVKDLLKQWAA